MGALCALATAARPCSHSLLAHSSCRKVGILRIQGKHFQIEPIPLKTVRPFKMDEVVLSEEAAKVENDIDLEKRETITAFLATRVGLPGQGSEAGPGRADGILGVSGRGAHRRGEEGLGGAARRRWRGDDAPANPSAGELAPHPPTVSGMTDLALHDRSRPRGRATPATPYGSASSLSARLQTPKTCCSTTSASWRPRGVSALLFLERTRFQLTPRFGPQATASCPTSPTLTSTTTATC